MHVCRNFTMFIFKNKMIASDNRTFFIYCRCNTMCHNIVDLGMHLFMLKATLCCCICNLFCHRMREMFFQTGCDTQKLVFAHSIERNNLYNGRAGFCQSTCLIKYDCICFCHGFHIFAAFYRDAVRVRLTNCRQYRNRHGKF